MAGIYIHIPFCKKRCLYCDFFSTTEGNRLPSYIHAVEHEALLRKSYLADEPVNTLYFGGGTPSQMDNTQLETLIGVVKNLFNFSSEAEITLEANPDDLSSEYLSHLFLLGINRISIGIQTFDNSLLSLLGRRHTARGAIEAVARCRAAGFRNISIDLMYGLPGETAEMWDADLSQAVALKVEHISAYSLSYEENTPLERMLRKGELSPASEDTSLQCFQRLMDCLNEAGFRHYEISNFARPGYESRHNSSYWNGTPYLGLGAAAHSYDGHSSRQANIASLSLYIQGITSGEPYFEHEELDLNEQYNDVIITHLRTAEGLPLKMLEERFGTQWANYCTDKAYPFIEKKWLDLQDECLRLTRSGLFMSDGIFRELIYVT